MAGISVPFQSLESANETNEQGDPLVPNQATLLRKLLEQNKLLEEDHRFLPHISHTGSQTSGDSTSMHSADSLGSLRNSAHTPSQRDEFPHTNSAPTLSPGDDKKGTNDSSEPAREFNLEVSDTPSPVLLSPTEVRSKPLPLADSADTKNYESNYDDYESRYNGAESDTSDIGLGPSACILLDDEFETRIEYEEVVPEVLTNVGEDIFSPELPVSNFGTMTGAQQGGEERGWGVRGQSSARGLKKTSIITSTSDIMFSLQNDNHDEEGDVLKGGNKDRERMLNIVPVDKPSSVRRARSDTESIGATRKVSLSLLAHQGRKRTQTLVEGSNVIREIPEEKDEETLPEVEPERTEEEELWHTWSGLLRNWEESVKKNMKLIKQLARQGIPDPLRGMAWQLIANSQDASLKEQYPSLITGVSPFERAIQRDLARTFPEHSFFKESDGLGQEGLMNILKAYSIVDREVGYCQGSPFITGLLLMKMPEEDAFCVFVSLMKNYRLRDLFKPSMSDLGLCFYQLEKCIEELYPDLYVHFMAVGFQTSMYASPWFLTMFASVLSLNVVFRIMDIFLLEGREILFRIGLALIEHNVDKLMTSDLEEIVKYFQKELKSIHEADPEGLIQRALKIRYNSKKMKKLEKDYVARKEKQAQDSKELTRLQCENSELLQRIYALEKECASLADRLIQGQVTLAQEAEEKFILKKKLSVAQRTVSELEKPDKPISEDGKVMEGDGEGVRSDGVESQQADEHNLLSPKNTKPNHSPPAYIKLALFKETQPGDGPAVGENPLGTPHPDTPDIESNPSAVGTKDKSKSQKSKIKKRFSTKLSHKFDNDSKHKVKKDDDTDPKLSDRNLTSPTDVREGGREGSASPTPQKKAHRRKKSKSLSGDLTLELAKAKLQCAETAHQLEHKILDLSKTLNREAFVVRELKAAKEHIMELEQTLLELRSVRCSHCDRAVYSEDNTNSDLADDAATGQTKSNDSKALRTQLRAMWNTKPETVSLNEPDINDSDNSSP